MNNDILSQFHNNTLQQMANVQSNNDQMSQAAQGGNGVPASPDFVTSAQMAADNAKQAQQPADQGQPAAPQQQPDGNGGNWFTKALPTIGSIAAPILGALLAPGTGGVSLLAGLALAGGGSAAGKLGENAIEGKSDLGNGVADSAVSGSVGQLAGGLAGKALGGVVGAMGKTAEKGIAAKAFGTEAEQTYKGAQDLKNTYGGVPKHQLESNNPNQGLVGLQKFADSAGLQHTDAQGINTASNQMLDHLGKTRDAILQQSGPIATGGGVDAAGKPVQASIQDMIRSALTNEDPLTGVPNGASHTDILGSLDPSGDAALNGGTTKFLSTLAKGNVKNDSTDFLQQAHSILGEHLNVDTSDPVALLKAQGKVGDRANTYRELASNAKMQGDPNALKLQSQADAWSQLNNSLKDTLYNRGVVDDAVQGAKTGMAKTAADFGGNQQLADMFNTRLQGLTSGSDLNSALSEGMNARDISKSALSIAQNPTNPGAMNALKGDLPVAEQGGDAIGLPTSKTGMVAGLANKVLGAVGNGGATSQVASKLADTLTGASKIAPNMTNAGLIGTIGAQTVAGAPNYQQAAGTNTMVNPLNVGNPATGNPISDIMGSNAPGADAAKLALVSSYFTPNWNGGGGTANPQAIADFSQHQQKSSEVQAQVNSYIHALNAAGGAQGAVPGLLAQLGGAMTGGPVAGLNAQRQQLEASLAQLYGHPVSLPSTMMNQQAANGVLGQLGNTLNASSGF